MKKIINEQVVMALTKTKKCETVKSKRNKKVKTNENKKVLMTC